MRRWACGLLLLAACVNNLRAAKQSAPATEAAAAVTAAVAQPPPPIPLEQVVGQPTGALPFRITWSPDGREVYYLRARAGSRVSDLWALDSQTGQERRVLDAGGPQKLTPEERAQRERQRVRHRGIGRYIWNPDGKSLLIPRSGDLYVLRDGEQERLTQTSAPELNPAWSPDGRSLAYVRAQNIYVRSNGEEHAITQEGRGKLRCGLAEFIAQEELGRHTGFWWSLDSKSIAYLRTDSTKVPLFRYHDYLAPAGRQIEQEYPRAGDANVEWRLGIVPAAGGETVWMQVEGEYLARVNWMPDGALAVQVINREQTSLKLYRCDPGTGESTLLLEEQDDAWVMLHRNLRFLSDGRFLWTSERHGFRHIYLVDGQELRPLTHGSWEMRGVVALDEEAGLVYFTGSRESLLERHLYRVDLEGRRIERLTKEPGWHSTVLSPDYSWFVDTWSRAGVPPTITLRETAGERSRVLAQSKTLPDLPRPEFFTVKAPDGTELSAMVLKPTLPGRRPAIVYTYGGPTAQLVADRWGGRRYLFHVRLARKGYAVFTLDNRGSAGRGRDFSRAVAGTLCEQEWRDQAAGVQWLGSQPYVDPARIGIWGWSYGGTMSLMCLLRAPELFSAAVAGAPVCDWRDYDTAYTERYMRTPQQNPKGYAASSPITYVDKLRHPLLIVHGVRDDNVHFRTTVAFVDKAQRKGKLVEMDFYPRAAHGLGGPAMNRLFYSRFERFFDTHLAGN